MTWVALGTVTGVVRVERVERRHTLRCFTAVQVKRPAVVARVLPTFLQVVPAIDGAVTTGVAAVGTATADGGSSSAGVATGKMPVSAAAPTLIV